MKENLLSLGDKIELFHCSNRTGSVSKPKIYMSQLLDFLEDGTVSIAMPIERSRVVLLGVGETYNLCFYTQFGLYQCKAVVKERYRNKNLFIAIVMFTSEFEKNQRRHFYRLKCMIDVCYGILTEDEAPKISFHGVITDISGGGVRFLTERQHNTTDLLLLSFALDTSQGLKTFQIVGNIINLLKVPNRVRQYEYRIEFSDISKEDREIVVRYIFDEERKLRRKDRGLN